MDKNLKKTKEAYGTVSEEAALEQAENTEETTKKMIENKNIEEEETKEKEAQKNFEEKEEKEKEKEEKKPRRRGEPTREEMLDAWTPKTKLGKDVKNGKITSIETILDENQKILEPEIVDKLLQIKTDLISIGQAKGKFGGGKRRAWRQTQRITKEGGVLTF